MPRPTATVVLVLVVALAGACGDHGDGGARGTTGDLDPSFGVAGTVDTAFLSSAFLNGLALAPDGDIIAVGSAQIVAFGAVHGALARYHANGRLDEAFGDGGTVSTVVGSISTIAGVAVQSDGAIVAAGMSAPFEGAPILTLARYDPTGHLDATFGRDGLATTDIADVAPDARTIVPTGDGFVVGGVFTAAGRDGVLVARYLRDGVPDPRFGTDGLTLVDLPADTATMLMRLEPDGSVTAAATVVFEPSGFGLAFVRLRSDGMLDPTFGDGGRIVVVQERVPDLVTFDSTGALLLSVTDDDLAVHLVRYRTNGTRDDTYRTGDLGGVPNAAVFDALGNLVLALIAGDGARLVRLLPSGDFDARFGDGGGVTTHPSGGVYPTGVLLDSAGRILVGGITTEDISRFVLLRYFD
jgi:uncharacterized delta-60 repeat protein